jgi:peptidase E
MPSPDSRADQRVGAIVAIGGAELRRRPGDDAIHDYIASLLAPRPKVCLLPTASGDPREQIVAFHAAMERRGAIPSSISLFRRGDHDGDLADHLLAQDAVYVTGGSMVNLMALWREHGIDRVMRVAHRRGILLCGYSAGSMCWFEAGISRGSGAPALVPGIGLLAGSHCVHYSQDPGRRGAYREAVASGATVPGLALDDHAAALFRGGRLIAAVSARSSSSAYRVDPGPRGGVSETPLPTRLLPHRAAEPDPAVAEMREHHRRRAAPIGIGRRRARG